MRKKSQVSTAGALRPVMRRATALVAVAVAVAVALAGLVTLALGVPWGSGTGSASPGGSLTCSVKASCGAGEVQVFRMSSVANAHAGTAAGSAYANSVCCGDVAGLGTGCSGVYDTAQTLSAADNAHAATDGSYGTAVCLSGYGDDATADVAYTTGDCDVGYACLATLSGSTNAHVADCDGTDDYGTKVCGLVTEDNCPTTSNPGQENADGDAWGDACETADCINVATSWFTPVGDGDCDGWTTDRENYLVTDPNDMCAGTPGQNDEGPPDMWPTDFNDDQKANMQDVIFAFVTTLAPYGGLNVAVATDPPVLQREDFNQDGWVRLQDVILGYVSKLAPTGLNTMCTP